MNLKEYYKAIFPKLEKGFQRTHWVLGAGKELFRDGWDPNGLPVTVRPVEELYNLSVNKELQVYIPVVNCKDHWNQNVQGPHALLMPFDFEIALGDAQNALYGHVGSQLHYFKKHITPVADHISGYLKEKNSPFVLDWTPSGGHFLNFVVRGHDGWNALHEIGYEHPIVYDYCKHLDHNDMKRNPAMDDEATKVYGGICLIAEYIGLKTKQSVRPRDDLPVTLWDSEDKCMNIDISWTSDPAYMRIIRAPFSAHKKNMQQYNIGDHSLVDVMGEYFCGHDSNDNIKCDDIDHIVHTMWDFARAVEHSKGFSGNIPYSNEGMRNIVEEYKRSPLKEFHDYVHYGEKDLEPGEGRYRALNDSRLNPKSIGMVQTPNPRMKTPRFMRKFVFDLFEKGWHPKHIANAVTDCYRDSFFNWHTDRNCNWNKYIPEKKALAYARQYSAAFLMKQNPDFKV